MVATFHTVHLNGTYFGGQRLDRFSMYEFGLFDATRMHGVPSAVRFGELAMARGSYSFNVLNQYRLDLFLDPRLAVAAVGVAEPVGGSTDQEGEPWLARKANGSRRGSSRSKPAPLT